MCSTTRSFPHKKILATEGDLLLWHAGPSNHECVSACVWWERGVFDGVLLKVKENAEQIHA